MFAYYEVLPGDIVFLTSDGISDNFDPVVGKFCVPKKPERTSSNKVRFTFDETLDLFREAAKKVLFLVPSA